MLTLFRPVLSRVPLFAILLATPVFATELPAIDAETRVARMADFAQSINRSVIEFQPFRSAVTVTNADGQDVTLTSLNTTINTWYLLERGTGRGSVQAHLENAQPDLWRATLSDDGAQMVITGPEGVTRCDIWFDLDAAQAVGLPYAPICEGRFYLRSRGSGARSSREAVAEFLRGYVPFGETIITVIKDTLFEDRYLTTAEEVDAALAGQMVEALGRAQLRQHPVMRVGLGFDLEGTERGQVEAGAWYAVTDAPGIYASAMQSGMIDPAILNRRGEANNLDGVENRADIYLVAFDLSLFDMGFEMGTDHPAVNWSPRPSGPGRNNRLSGPDGFNTLAPLAMTGVLSPNLTDLVAATFTAGFKREHGAWRRGFRSQSRHGHHYGFVQHGVVLSRLQPGLATIIVWDNGRIEMRDWTEEDDERLEHVRFARQNGVPLVAPNADGDSVPTPETRDWMGGNWSGSAEAQLRTLRGGACMREVADRQVLIYAVFSSATPSGMSRTFQAYGCDYAMLLDMNSLDLSYMALYTRPEGELRVQHLDRRMVESDPRARNGTRLMRFVETSDNRDFFYLIRRTGARP